MAGSAQDIEAGRAYITVYLRRADYDRQIDDLKRSEGDDRPSATVAGAAEAAESVAEIAARGAIMRASGDAMTAVLSRLGITAVVVAPALAATGTAASGAAVGFGAMAAAALPILIPLAAIAAAAGLVYVTLFKWEKLPFVVKALMLVLSPLVVVIRAAVLAFKALKLAVSIVTAPFWLAAAAVRGFFAAIRAIPRVITATIGLMRRLGVAAVEMAVKVTKAAAAIPGRLARATAAGLRDVGTSIAKIGAIGAGITAAIVGPATLAARSWAAYGETIRGVQNDLLKFQLTAEEASIIARVSEQTGESTERLAEQMRDGTRDFSRWRNELQQSGTLMTGPGLAAALALSRAYFSLKESAAGLKNTIGAALGPALMESTEIITGMVRGITRWVSENKPLVVQVFKIASAVGIAAGVITTLGGAIVGAGTFLSPFTAALAGIAGVMAIVEVKTEAGRSIWAAYGDSVRRVYGTVVQYLGEMMEFADRVIGGVTDALIAGDLAAAVDVMWNAAKVVWISALLEIDELTSGTFGSILQSLAAGDWAAAGEGAMNALRQAWLTGVGFLAGIWDQVLDAADSAWAGILSGFDAVVAGLKSGLASVLEFAAIKVIGPMITAMEKVPGFDLGLADTLQAARTALLDASGAAHRAADELGADRPAELADRQAARQAASDDARVAREVKIAALRSRQAELAQQSGEKAESERTANQNALDASLAAAKAARDAADANKLQERDFAVSQDVQSIARFSGEALGLSVGRGDDPARKAVKLSEDQLKELRLLKQAVIENQREMLRLQAMGGFA